MRVFRLFFSLFASLFLVAPAVVSASEAEALRTMSGGWEITAMSQDGQEVPTDQLPEVTMEFKEDGTVTGVTPEGEVEASVSLSTDVEPKTIDITHTGGVYQDKSQYGIYELDGDQMTIAITVPGAVIEDRPDNFSTGVVMTFRRIK